MQPLWGVPPALCCCCSCWHPTSAQIHHLAAMPVLLPSVTLSPCAPSPCIHSASEGTGAAAAPSSSVGSCTSGNSGFPHVMDGMYKQMITYQAHLDASLGGRQNIIGNVLWFPWQVGGQCYAVAHTGKVVAWQVDSPTVASQCTCVPPGSQQHAMHSCWTPECHIPPCLPGSAVKSQ